MRATGVRFRMVHPPPSSNILPDGTEWPHDFGYTLMPDLPASAARRGGRFARGLGRFVMRLLGWRLEGPYPDVPRLIIAGGPHTSNWDGIIGIAAVLALQIDIRIMVKHSAFVGPLGMILRWVRAIPVDRSAPHGVTEQMIRQFREADRFLLGVTPEGTREYVDRWRTGWYHIAEGADVPILTVALDFGRKEIRLGPTFFPTGDVEADFARMKAFIDTAAPKNPKHY